MNAGFEDCLILDQAIEKGDNWTSIFDNFQKERKADADAIRELGLQNFIEMRDLVGDSNFLIRKQIEAKLHELYPQKWIPQYTMVTFTHMPYSEALSEGKKKDIIMDQIMQIPDIQKNWKNLDFEEIVNKI